MDVADGIKGLIASLGLLVYAVKFYTLAQKSTGTSKGIKRSYACAILFGFVGVVALSASITVLVTRG